MTTGPNAGLRSWWDVAYQSKAAVPLNQQNPRLLQIYNATNYTLHDIALLNGPTFHVALASTTGFVAWGIKILTPSLEYTKPGYACPAGTMPDKVTPATCFTPNTVVNTDGFDPGSSQNLLLAYSYISDGDDNVAIGAGGLPLSQNHLYAHNKFYYGHGLSIGSYTLLRLYQQCHGVTASLWQLLSMMRGHLFQRVETEYEVRKRREQEAIKWAELQAGLFV